MSNATLKQIAAELAAVSQRLSTLIADLPTAALQEARAQAQAENEPIRDGFRAQALKEAQTQAMYDNESLHRKAELAVSAAEKQSGKLISDARNQAEAFGSCPRFGCRGFCVGVSEGMSHGRLRLHADAWRAQHRDGGQLCGHVDEGPAGHSRQVLQGEGFPVPAATARSVPGSG